METKFSTVDEKTVKSRESDIAEPFPKNDHNDIHSNVQYAFDTNIEDRISNDSIPLEEKGNTSSVDSQGSETSNSKEFVSPSHQIASEIFGESNDLQIKGNEIDSSNLLAKAEQIAFSMGSSGRYEENPFSQELESRLHHQYQTGSSKDLLQQEMNIGSKENDMDM